MSFLRHAVATTVVVTLAVGSGITLPTTANAQAARSVAPMIDSVAPAVVNISVNGQIAVENPLANNPFFRGFLDQIPREREFQSAGSGVIVDAAQGLLLTNHHVIENANEINVTLFDNRTAVAEIIGSDQASDLALLKIDLADLTEIAIGNSDTARVGDFVVAIGNPFGFSHTVTSGIVSGLGRSGVNPDRGAYEDFIQTDASINPGNSGGALVSFDGELIGINSAILSRSGGNIGIGFAIPVNMARNVMDQLIQYGEVQRGLLGVSISPVRSSLVEQYNLPDTAGAFVTEVAAGSAAEAAGIEIQDVIVSVDGRAVDSPDALRNLIGLHRPGEAVDIEYIRDGRRQGVRAVLGTQDSAAFATSAPPTPPAALDDIIPGTQLSPDSTSSGAAGLRVIEIDEDSPAYMAGLRTGDLIMRLNRQRVTTLSEATAVMRRSPRGVVALVRRGNRESIVLLP